MFKSFAPDDSGTTNDLSATFAYNPASQIASNVRTGDAYAWTGHFNPNVTGTPNGLNQLTAVGPKTLTHDTKGNVTAFGTKSFTYSSENLLLTGPGSTTLSYDGLMRLRRIVAGGATVNLVYDGLDRIAEVSSSVIQRRYVHGPGVDEPLVWYEGTGATDRRFLSSDERGSIVSVTNSTGAMLGINRYDEVGQPQSTNLGVFGYTGQAWVPSIGAWYYKERVYEPELGRFLQPDPIGYDGGSNLYAYVGNDAVNFTDPLGNEALNRSARRAGQTIFGTMINYSRVQITWNSNIVPSNKVATTIGNIINVRSNWISNVDFIHELTHVWQYQNGIYDVNGMAFFSWMGWVLGINTYVYDPITAESEFDNYTLEQQAQIVQDCAAGGTAACGLLERSKYSFNPLLKGLIVTPISIWDPLYPKIGPERTGRVIVLEPDEPDEPDEPPTE